MSDLSSRAVRAQLDHPVIDADGHIIEFLPAVGPNDNQNTDKAEPDGGPARP